MKDIKGFVSHIGQAGNTSHIGHTGHMSLLWVLLIFAGTLNSHAGETVTFSLPSSLTVVEEEAFAGASISDLTLPDGMQEIGARAFADTQLYTIGVPES